jgi:AraC family transcriptional regulator, transcriptional activator FtrA
MTPHRVVAVVPDQVVLLDLAAPVHLFGHLGARRYDFSLAAVSPGTVRTSTGFALVVERGLRMLARADTVVVPGYTRIDRRPPTELLRALQQAATRGARVMSICTGAFALAHAGLLDGCRATTHWDSTDLLASSFPQVKVDPNVLFADEGGVLTSAGVAAGLDLCLHVIRRDHGAAVAGAYARRTVVAPHRDGGQAQFIDLPTPRTDDGRADLAATRTWALERLDQRLDVSTLAKHAVVSPRTFARKFLAETGTTPHKWLLHQRVLEARRLLETSHASIEEIASVSGLGSAAAFRISFKRETGTSPTAYRQAFTQR